VIVSSSADS